MPPMSLWRPDKMRELTYTQFWELVRERQVESVSPACMPARQSLHSRQAMLFGTCHVCDWTCSDHKTQTKRAPGPGSCVCMLVAAAELTGATVLPSAAVLRRHGCLGQAQTQRRTACLLFPLSALESQAAAPSSSACAALSACAAVLYARLCCKLGPCCRTPAGAGQATTATKRTAAPSVQAAAQGARRLLRHSRLLLYQHSRLHCTAAGPVYIGQAVVEGAREKNCARWGALGESGAAL